MITNAILRTSRNGNAAIYSNGKRVRRFEGFNAKEEAVKFLRENAPAGWLWRDADGSGGYVIRRPATPCGVPMFSGGRLLGFCDSVAQGAHDHTTTVEG